MNVGTAARLISHRWGRWGGVIVPARGEKGTGGVAHFRRTSVSSLLATAHPALWGGVEQEQACGWDKEASVCGAGSRTISSLGQASASLGGSKQAPTVRLSREVRAPLAANAPRVRHSGSEPCRAVLADCPCKPMQLTCNVQSWCWAMR